MADSRVYNSFGGTFLWEVSIIGSIVYLGLAVNRVVVLGDYDTQNYATTNSPSTPD